MRTVSRPVAAAVLLVSACIATGSLAAQSGTLDWRAARNEVDARLDGWPVSVLLAEIAAATGWRVYLEPGTESEITARFEKLSETDALRRLLGHLNFALLPQPDGPRALLVFRSAIAQATQRIAAGLTRSTHAAGRVIPHERIVVLDGGGESDAAALARRVGATIVGAVPGRRAYRLAFDDERAARAGQRALEDDPAVAFVESNVAVTPPATVEPLAAGGGSPVTLRPDVSPSADSVIVGLIDTAVQAADPRLAAFLEPGLSVVGDYRPAEGPLSHGTAMAATIIDGAARALRERGDGSGVVPLTILPVDVYGGNEETTMFDVALGLAEALDRRVNVVNLSLGGETGSRLLRDLIQDAVARGVLFFASAGNEGGTERRYPAADPGVVSVTAAGAEGGIASWANRGSWIDAVAPASNVITYLDRPWYASGTSVATSWVSGWTAGTMTATRRGPLQVQRRALARWGVDAN